MYRSLTPSPAMVGLGTTLSSQQATVRTCSAALTAARAAQGAAHIELATTTTAFATARSRFEVAEQALTGARHVLMTASQQLPLTAAALSSAREAVNAAAAVASTRRVVARAAATALKSARSHAVNSAARSADALAAWQSASAAAIRTRQQIAALDDAADLSGEAATISPEVVTQVRAGFTVADTTTVYGVTVHRSIAFAFRHMIDDAGADGVVMSGGGFRTAERQIELRKINGCPDVWTAPASSCRVPTALPGRSLHQFGLAVDISSGGRTITARTAAFSWLTTHAARYGFKNLPSEPWHWSISGS